MKSMLNLAVMLLYLLLIVGTATAQIRNSAHDLSSSSTTTGPKSTDTDKVCVFCHSPHTNQTTTVLWNRNASSATYTPYSSSTMEQTVGQPSGSSKNCLSCHDGTVAFNSIINSPGSGTGTAPAFAVGSTSMDTTNIPGLGTVLSNDHPVSFTYSTHQATDADLRAASLVSGKPVVSYGGVTLPLSGTSTANGTLECYSCHDPHETGIATFLRDANTASALCFTCHDK